MTSPHSFICAHDFESKSLLNVVLQGWWDEVKDESGGRFDVEMKIDGAAGGPDEMVAQLLDNRIQIHPVSGMILADLVPVIAVEGLPFAYGSTADGCQAMAGRVGDIVRDALRKKGIHALRQVLPQGMNQISSNSRSIETVEDMDRFRLRVGNSPYLKDLYSSLGCDPQPIDLQDATAALMDGRAEGLEMPYYGIQRGGRHETQRHIAVLDIRFACFWLCFNLDAWNALDPDIREMLERRYEAAAERYIEQIDAKNEEGHAFLSEAGVSFTRVDTSGFKKRLSESGFNDRWRGIVGDEAWTAIQDARRA